MLGFTLSKINLLLLVTATFAIIAYFMFGLEGMIISQAAQQTAEAYGEKASAAITSDSLCFKTDITVPKSISYYGSKEFFYLMHISRYPETYDPEYLTSVIFSISDRSSPDKLRAASRIDLNAEVIFYDWDPLLLNEIDNTPSSITLDPQSRSPQKNSFIMIKEILLGKTILHVIACSAGNTCLANLDAVGCTVKAERGGATSNCIPCSS